MGGGTKLQHKRMQVHAEAVTPITLQLIKDISKLSFIQDFHLAGGTALALQIGHRLSIDLDFFSTKEFDPRRCIRGISELGKVENLQIGESELLCFINGVKVELMYFAYPPKYRLKKLLGIKVLDPIDIAMFKLLALIGRNRKKDIIDLYFIDREIKPLKDVFAEFIATFDNGDINLLKQLELLFDDVAIEKSDMPVMLKEVEWEKAYGHIKKAIGNEIRTLLLH